MFAGIVLVCIVGFVSAQPAPNVPCGIPTVQPITTRIVGGIVARPGSWPWTVLLEDDLGYISGTGSLIDHQVILTTAQHFEGEGYSLFDLDLHLWNIYAGEYNISTVDPHEKKYHIRRVVVHPGYNYTTLANDVALVITTQAVVFNEHTRPACLADAAHMYVVGEKCYLPGWGKTQNTGDEEVMNQLDLPILDDAICQKHFPDYLPTTEMCAGYENQTKDWCEEDLGGPLMCKDNNGAWYIQGLASSGGDCKTSDEPSVFEDVSTYSDWIKKTMEDAGFPYRY